MGFAPSSASRRALVESVEDRHYCDADNVITGAVDVATLVLYVSKTGSIDKSTDSKDFYKFTVPSSTTAFRLRLSGLAADTNLYLYNSGKSVIDQSTASGTTSETITRTGLAAGTYYLRVSQGSVGQYGSASFYNLQYHVPTDEAGNTYAAAKYVNTPYTLQGQIGGFDRSDFFKFDVPDNAYLSIEVTSFDTSAAAQLYGPGAEYIDSKGFVAGTPAKFTYFMHDEGTYILGLIGTSKQLTKYSVSIKTQPFQG